MPRSRVIGSKTVEKKLFYCRRCMKNKPATDFFASTDSLLDRNGHMSICKDCCNDLYARFELTEMTIEKTLLKMCRLLNVIYDVNTVNTTIKRIQTLEGKGKKVESNIFGLYKASLVTLQNSWSKDGRTVDFTFFEPTLEVKEKLKSSNFVDKEYLERVWGKGADLDKEDYEFLEDEYGRWAGPIGNVTHGEDVLIRDICHLQNNIRKARIAGEYKLVDSLIESRQKLMRDGALTPALQSAANSGKNADCFGVWLRDIETKRPAEWFEDQTKYHDMDGMDADMKDIIRSMKNFVTESRDFNTTDIESIDAVDGIDEGE